MSNPAFADPYEHGLSLAAAGRHGDAINQFEAALGRNPNDGRVLFALNGGERVTVLDSSRGWLKIKDDQGRTGWIFSDGVKRG